MVATEAAVAALVGVSAATVLTDTLVTATGTEAGLVATDDPQAVSETSQTVRINQPNLLCILTS
jgi:hypothetical protein